MKLECCVNKNDLKESSAVINRSQLKRQLESQTTLRHRLHNLQTSLSKTFQKYTVERIFCFRTQTGQLEIVMYQRCRVKLLHRASVGIKPLHAQK